MFKAGELKKDDNILVRVTVHAGVNFGEGLIVRPIHMKDESASKVANCSMFVRYADIIEKIERPVECDDVVTSEFTDFHRQTNSSAKTIGYGRVKFIDAETQLACVKWFKSTANLLELHPVTLVKLSDLKVYEGEIPSYEKE